LTETIVDYDQFFNGKRDQKEMKLALKESHFNLNRFKTHRKSGAASPSIASSRTSFQGNMSERSSATELFGTRRSKSTM
jgi:hypothetical protein